MMTLLVGSMKPGTSGSIKDILIPGDSETIDDNIVLHYAIFHYCCCCFYIHLEYKKEQFAWAGHADLGI